MIRPPLTIVRKGERIPTPVVEKDGTLGGWVRRQADSDGFAVEGGVAFLSEAELLAALAALRKARRER